MLDIKILKQRIMSNQDTFTLTKDMPRYDSNDIGFKALKKCIKSPRTSKCVRIKIDQNIKYNE